MASAARAHGLGQARDGHPKTTFIGPVPGQRRWRIYGLGLRDAILKKVYAANAERLLSLSPVNA